MTSSVLHSSWQSQKLDFDVLCGNMRSFYSLVPHLVEAKHSLRKEAMEDTRVWNRIYNPFPLLLDSTDMSQSVFTCISTFIPYEDKVT